MPRTQRVAQPPAPSPWTDSEVVARVRAGERELYEVLMRRHNQRLFRVARSIVRDDGEAEDVVQDAWVRAYRELAAFRGDAAFVTWVTRIAVHEALARAKRRRRLVAVEETGMPQIDDLPACDEHGPERTAANGELRATLHAAVESLPASLRTVFVLRDVEGLSTEETAGALDLTVANVKVRLHRARAALRADLDARLGQETRHLYLFAGPRCDTTVATVFARLGLG